MNVEVGREIYTPQVTAPSSSHQRTFRKIKGVKDAVFFLMDWEEEFRNREKAIEKGNLWKLTHRVGALLGRGVNPETVARRRREYWNGGA